MVLASLLDTCEPALVHWVSNCFKKIFNCYYIQSERATPCVQTPCSRQLIIQLEITQNESRSPLNVPSECDVDLNQHIQQAS